MDGFIHGMSPSSIGGTWMVKGGGVQKNLACTPKTSSPRTMGIHSDLQGRTYEWRLIAQTEMFRVAPPHNLSTDTLST